ncbi:CusA/CzcA family heavy metal efflux RND transporter [Pseudoalteromonas piscicida]|uniref:efflux RND transporter permease subunit n=1 Tax=Pseudoalteromonas piscicida TaxID=43662 RepID=UPI0030B6BA92
MLDAVIRFSLIQRVFITLSTLLVVLFGAKAWFDLPIDAFPDIAPAQVKIVLKAPGMTTTEIETQITRIIETELLGIPAQEILRSTTKYAITDITIDFAEGTDIYWARQQVNERLMAIWPELPSTVSGGIAPMSTPLSEMFMFTIDNPTLSLRQLRTILDWQIRPTLRTVAGVADVNSLGGYVSTFEITPAIAVMHQLGIQMEDIEQAVASNNLNGGLGRINKGNDSIVVRTQGKFEGLTDLENLIVKADNEQFYRLSEVATIREGHLSRYGAVTHNGKEAVQGLVIALKGSNTDKVVSAVKAKLAELQSSLPLGTKINVFYDRSTLINTAIATITNALVQAVLLVIILLAVFLGNVRAALVVSISLPLSALATFLLMHYFSISANLMSLGGLVIAIGMLVDASVVVVENAVNRLAQGRGLPRLHIIYRACKEVAIPTVSGTAIVIIVFSPLLTLTGLEGKLFGPVALTIVFAMISALIFAFTVIPLFASLLLKAGTVTEPKLVTVLRYYYQRSLITAIAFPKTLTLSAVILLLFSGGAFLGLGKSFMPTLDEGDIIVQLEKSPSINLQASLEIDSQVEEAILAAVPEVVQVIARTGSDELGLDPMSLNETDVFMELLPRSQWRFDTKAELIEAIRDVLADYPGMNINFTQPIQMRVSEMLTGGTSDVSIKIFGEEVSTLTQLAEQVSQIVSELPTSKDVQMALIDGGQFVRLKLNPEVASTYQMSVQGLSNYLKPQLEGRLLSQVVAANKFTPIMLAASRTPEAQITSIAELKRRPVLMPDGNMLMLSDIAEVSIQQEPLMIERENGRRFVSVSTNVEGIDVVSFVATLNNKINQKLTLPSGYSLSFGGEFENQQRAMHSLLLVIPLALLLIFLILFSTFKSMALAVLILCNIPFALMGGIFALYISGQYLSIPASVGFIALLGVAVLNGVVMVSYFEQSKLQNSALSTRVIEGASRRLRPVLMTATTAMFGLLPLVFATGPGAEIQKPLAIVVIGGLLTSTVTTLYLLPIFYQFVEKRHG